MHNNYKCSFLQLDITPNVSFKNPAFLQGMAGGLRESVAVALPLSIEMCMLEDVHYTKLLFVTADIIGFDKTVVAAVRNHAAKWGIDPEGIVLNASHTHYAPGTISSMPETMGPFYENYSKQIEQLIASNLQNLYDHLEHCNIYHGMAEARIGVNRRLLKGNKVFFAPNPEGVYITATPLIKIELSSSNKTILWVNHGCHPTGMGSDTRISSDYPGFMKIALKKNNVADFVMFFQGAGGSSKEGQEGERTWKFSNNGSEVRQNGLKLAGIVKEAVEKGLKPVNGNFYCTMKDMVLPLRESPKSNELMNGHRSKFQSTSISDPPFCRQDCPKTSGGSPGSMSLEVQMVCLGDGPNVLTFPAEPVAELAERIQRINGFSNNDFFLGYTNGLEGYIPTDKILLEGGYEAVQSHLVYQKPAGFAFGTEKVVVDSVKALLNDKKEKNASNGYGRYHQSTGQRNAFFVLSSGRCGTMTLARLLDTAGNARVWHHPQPDPIRESLLAWRKKIDISSAFWRMRSSVIYKSWAEGLIHGETDLLMTPFVKNIAEEIPNSKFIILVREPGGFVRSGMRRNYYQGHPWDIGRLRPEEGSEEFKKWASLDQFEKICWLWNETYSRIYEMTETLPENRKLIVKFEKITTSLDATKDLFQFLELDGYDEAKIKQILERKLNAQQSGNFPNSVDWNVGQQEKAERQYGKLREKIGYPSSGNIGTKKQEKMVKLEKINNKPKILFLEQKYQSTGGHLDHIVSSLTDKYNVKYLKTLNPNEALSGINWADIVWLEWANQMTIYATNLPQIKNKKVVCRLHGYEVFTEMPTKIKWNNVNRLIFVANHKKEIFNSKIHKIKTKQCVIRNGIDLDKFTIPINKRNTKKLVLLGHLNFRKGLPILLHFYQQLLKRDPSYFLYVRGEFQDHRLEMASRTMIQEMGLIDKVEFVDWVTDLNAWLADKSHILSFSLEESFHYAIGNGMAAGLKPVIHAWTESRDIWPNDFIFKNLDEFLTIVSHEEYQPDRYRQLLIDNHLTAKSQLHEIENILQDLDGSKKKAANGEIEVIHDLNNVHSNQKERENNSATREKNTKHIKTEYAKHKEVYRQIDKNQFNNSNELLLWLREGESIEPYMNLNYALVKNGQSFDDNELINSLQNTLHRMCTSYFNYSLITPDDRKLIARLGQLLNDRKLCKTINASHTDERLMSSVYNTLQEIVPRSEKKCEIKISSMEREKELSSKHQKVFSIYNNFRENFKNLFEEGYLSLFIVHGSMSTLDYTLFSDVDTQIFLTGKAFTNENTIQQTKRVVSDANRHIKFFDPLQHHGYFISTDLDRMNYPQSYLPYETMAQGTRILGPAKQTFNDRSCVYEIRTAIWNLSYFFRKTFLENYRPTNPFDMKRYLSRFSMLPVLYLELFENVFPYKRESFALAKPFFPDINWRVFDTVSKARKKWVPSSLLQFNDQFFYQVWTFAEIMLSRLKEQTNE